MQTSEQIGEVASALAKAQGEFQPIEKAKTAKVKGQTKDGRSFDYTYKYADIADVLAGVLPPLSKHGLSVIQPTVVIDGVMIIRTRLLHSSGQWIESDYPVSSINGDHQKMGGALTYARRYALCSLVGVAAEEDTDGEHAAEQPTPPNRKPQAKREDAGLSDADSAKAADLMLGTLEFCDSEDSLREWGKANKATTLKMTREDQQRITQAYMAKRGEILAQPQAAE
jgi:hypothetical protein